MSASNLNRHVEVLQLLVAVARDNPGAVTREDVYPGRLMEVCFDGDRYRGHIHNAAADTYEQVPRDVLDAAGFCRLRPGYEGDSPEFGPYLYFVDFTA